MMEIGGFQPLSSLRLSESCYETSKVVWQLEAHSRLLR